MAREATLNCSICYVYPVLAKGPVVRPSSFIINRIYTWLAV
jgi:hypothetical protein